MSVNSFWWRGYVHNRWSYLSVYNDDDDDDDDDDGDNDFGILSNESFARYTLLIILGDFDGFGVTKSIRILPSKPSNHLNASPDYNSSP